MQAILGCVVGLWNRLRAGSYSFGASVLRSWHQRAGGSREVLLLAVCGFGLTACRHAAPPAKGTSAFSYVEQGAAPPPKSSKREAEAVVSNAQYREATAVGELPQPKYPPRALRAGAGRVSVGVHVTVDAKGQVSDIRQSILTFTSPGRFAEDFRQAVEAALRQWKFTPAKIEYIETVTEKGFTYNRVRRTEYVEAEFDLAFTFSPEKGK